MIILLYYHIIIFLYSYIIILIYYYIIILLYYSTTILPPALLGHCCCLSHACLSTTVLSVAMLFLEVTDNSTAEDIISGQDHQGVVDVTSPDARPTAAV